MGLERHATFPGPRCPYATSGREPTRKRAGRKVMETYEKMLKFYAENPWRGPSADEALAPE